MISEKAPMSISNPMADSMSIYSKINVKPIQITSWSSISISFTKFVKNWQIKCAKFLDIDDPKQNLKVYIEYKSILFNKKIEIIEKKIIII